MTDNGMGDHDAMMQIALHVTHKVYQINQQNFKRGFS